ncbi:hypothetical protein EG329_005626 [Mollisiaceae sp. DMI_Dod_QoI]|nr:hypothetical protein EG329_005626 [Helotiales sp. DMI_Dod_QoI]
MTILPGAFPNTVSPAVKELMEKHFQLSNAPSTHNSHEADEEAFAALFTPNGLYELAEVQNQGHDAIIAVRRKLFETIPYREHPVTKVFTYGSDDLNLMCFGIVDYAYPEGTTNKKEWAGRYEIEKTSSGELKFKLVQIITIPAQEYKK